MDPMPQTPAHARPAPRDHLWVVAVIAACALLEVWASWVTIGSMSGFPRIGGRHGMPTDWILAVTTEAYWGYALYAWLAAAPGPRSRRFAMWSAVAVFALSLVGQAAAHLARPGATPAPAVVVFVTALPVIVLALIAILIHMRQLDREAAAQARTEVAAADERDDLRAGLEAARGERDAAVSEREALSGELTGALSGVRAELAEALTRAERLEQKLAAKSAQASASRARKGKQESAQADDITTEFRALDELQKDPGLRQPRMGAELGRRIGASPATGRRLHAKLTAQDHAAGSLTDRSADPSDERSG